MAIYQNRSRGFTLVEMMIVVGIVAILVTIAFPMYQEQVRKSRRAEAKAALVQLSMMLERVYTENNAYTVGGKDACLKDAPGCTEPIFTNKSPIDGAEAYYVLDLDVVDRSGTNDGYQIEAEPQPAGGQDEDQCGTLTLNDLGQKGVTGADAGVTADMCW